MNSFALLQDDVEDASDLSLNRSKPPAVTPTVVDVSEVKQEPKADAHPAVETKDSNSTDPNDENKEDKTPKEKDLSLEEYLAQKASLSSGLASLNIKGLRRANDGDDGFKKMSVLKKNESLEAGSIMEDVPVKEFHENKGLKDSTQAAVANNAEIQKFFKREPSERRRNDNPRRGYGERRGSRGRGDAPRGRGENGRGRGEYSTRGRGTDNPRGRGDTFRGRGGGENGRGRREGARGTRGRGRGTYRGNRDAFSRENSQSKTINGNVMDVPNVDDTAAFPTLG